MASTQTALHAAFIDDEALAIMAKQPRELDVAIDILMEVLFEVFENLHLLVNASPGKTEALLQYRGRGAKGHREARRAVDGQLRVKVPGRDLYVNVVESYKHLGTYASLRDSSMVNAKYRAGATMRSYAPMSYKVFGSPLIDETHKIIFMRALLMTRLLFGIHILVPSARQLKQLNHSYMVIVRRIVGEPRFKHTDRTDRQIREACGQPALECIISWMRLAYCARLVRVHPAALMSLLHARPGGKNMRWVEQLAHDTELLRHFLPVAFPSLREGPDEWATLMRSEVEWKTLIGHIHFYASVCDAQKGGDEELPRAFECVCGKAFHSSRALESHRRAQHGVRLEIQDYLSTAVCPACGANFHERLRLVSHVSDRRRPKCRDWIVENCNMLPPARARALRVKDRELRRAAQQAGHSHHLAKVPMS